MFHRKYSTMSSDFSDGIKVTDEDIAKYVKKHTHWWDRLDYHKVSDASQMAFLILSKTVEEPKKKRWFF